MLLHVTLLQSGGAAFSSSNLLDAKPNQKRQFAQITARKIAEHVTNIEIEQDCMCEQYYEQGRPLCKIVGRKEKEQLAVSILQIIIAIIIASCAMVINAYDI